MVEHPKFKDDDGYSLGEIAFMIIDMITGMIDMFLSLDEIIPPVGRIIIGVLNSIAVILFLVMIIMIIHTIKKYLIKPIRWISRCMGCMCCDENINIQNNNNNNNRPFPPNPAYDISGIENLSLSL
jgi:hypothetical protein